FRSRLQVLYTGAANTPGSLGQALSHVERMLQPIHLSEQIATLNDPRLPGDRSYAVDPLVEVEVCQPRLGGFSLLPSHIFVSPVSPRSNVAVPHARGASARHGSSRRVVDDGAHGERPLLQQRHGDFDVAGPGAGL